MQEDLTILHLDLDAFYASVEEVDNPSLKNIPMAVGGLSENSIITTANYPARKYGVHSAQPVFIAKSLCPNLVIMPMRRMKYVEMSGRVFSIIKSYSNIVEQVSIDEAYLDISHCKTDPMDIVTRLKDEIYSKTGLTASVGLSYNKFLAKLASDWNKPNGIKVIRKEDVPKILLDLPVKRLHGIGSVAAARLRELGIETIEDLYGLSKEFMVEFFGIHGEEVYERIRGIDLRPVEISRKRKSIGVEKTFSETDNLNEIREYIREFSRELSLDLLKKQISAETITVKIKYNDFIQKTRSKTLATGIYEWEQVCDVALDLLESFIIDRPIRLLGVYGSNLVDLNREQLDFLGSV